MYDIAMSTKRVLWGDVLRVIAMTLVVLIHSLAPYRYNFFDTHNTSCYLFIATIDAIARSAVPIFFMLTGYFATQKQITSYRVFLKNTIKKLIAPFTIFSLIIYIGLGILNNNQPSVREFIARFINGDGVQYHMWFMYAIIIIYLFLPFINKLLRHFNQKELLRLILLIFLFGNFLYTIQSLASAKNISILNNIVLPDIVIYTNYVVIGYYLNKYNTPAHLKQFIKIMAVISVFILPISSLLFTDYMDTDKLTSCMSVFSFFIGISIFIVTKDILCHHLFNKVDHRNFLVKAIQKLSRLSFVVYMIHPLILEFIRKNIYNFFAPSNILLELLDITVQFIISLSASICIAVTINAMSVFTKKIHRRIKTTLRINIDESKIRA